MIIIITGETKSSLNNVRSGLKVVEIDGALLIAFAFQVLF